LPHPQTICRILKRQENISNEFNKWTVLFSRGNELAAIRMSSAFQNPYQFLSGGMHVKDGDGLIALREFH